MSKKVPVTVLRCFAIPAHIRRAGDGWRLRVSICVRPRVYGTAGSYCLVSELEALDRLPTRLETLQLQLHVPGLPELSVPVSTDKRPELWSWEPDAFVEVQADEEARWALGRDSKDDIPYRYPRAELSRLLVGDAARGRVRVANLAGSFETDGIYATALCQSVGAQEVSSFTAHKTVDSLFLESLTSFDMSTLDVEPSRRAAITKRMRSLESELHATGAYSGVRVLEQARLFHELDEGAEHIESQGRLVDEFNGVRADHKVLPVAAADDQDRIVESAPCPVLVALPKDEEVFPGFSVKLRNCLGPLFVGQDQLSRFRINSTVAANAIRDGALALGANQEVTLKFDGSGWTASVTLIDIHLEPSHKGELIEREESQGIRLVLPLLAQDKAGFYVTACNRTGPLEVVESSGASTIRRIPENLVTPAAASHLEIREDVPIRISWDGRYWNIVSEGTDNEFHRNVAGLDNYPGLARAIGLTWDVEIPLTHQQLAAIGAEGVITLTAQTRDPSVRILLYGVAYEKYRVGRDLIACTPRSKTPATSLYRHGLRDLSGHNANEVEIDSPFLTLLARSKALLARQSYPLPDQDKWNALRSKSFRPEELAQSLPALVEAGIELSRAGWDMDRATALSASRRLENSSIKAIRERAARIQALSAPPDVLYLEQVIRGCRYDVFDDATESWTSLCGQVREIRGHATPDKILLTCPEEGAITPPVTGESTTKKKDGSVQPISRGSDVAFRWNGYGVCRPRPTLGVSRVTTSESVGGLGLYSTFKKPKRTEKKQRIGRYYTFRARVVDVAGGGWSKEEADSIDREVTAARLSPTLRKQRFQALKPPKLYSVAGPSKREVRTLVIRSYDKRRSRTVEYEVWCSRVDFELMQGLGVTDDASLENAMELIRTAHHRALRHAQSIQPYDSSQPRVPSPEAGNLVPEFLGIEDPDVRGTAFWYLPGFERPATARDVTLEPGEDIFDLARPIIADYRTQRTASEKHAPVAPVRVALSGGRERSSKRTSKGVSIVLPPGESQQIAVTSAPRPECIDHFGLFAAAVSAAPGSKEIIRKRCLEGSSPILSPYVVLQVVHATQRPVTIPVLNRERPPIRADREFGQLTASFRLPYEAHVPSTGRMDLEARWTDIDDSPSLRQWVEFGSHHQVDDWALDSQSTTFKLDGRREDLRPVSHNLTDTRRRTIHYSIVATSRYLEFFNHYATCPDTKVRPCSTEQCGQGAPVPTECQPKEELRCVGVQTPPCDPYLRPEEFTVTSEPVAVLVPNSGEPPPLEIEYIIPKSMIEEDYRWNGEYEARESTRELRVYFRRPAFLTGEGEMLGILVASSDAGSSSDSPNVSSLAEDPLSFSQPVIDSKLLQLTRKFFPAPDEPFRQVSRRVRDSSGKIQLEDAAVLGYRIQQREKEDLLFADVRIEKTERDSPFLRLALVRYQPESVEGAHISPQTSTAYIRPSADRSVSVQFKKVSSNPFSRRRKLIVQVVGPAAIDDEGNIQSDLVLTLMRRQSASREIPPERIAVPFAKEWKDASAFLAVWTAEINVKRPSTDPDTGFHGFSGQCDAHIVETHPLENGDESRWFTNFKLGMIGWDDEE